MSDPCSIVHLTDCASRRNGGIAESVLGLTEALASRSELQIDLFCGEDPDFERDRARFQQCTPQAFPLKGLGPLTVSPELQRALEEQAPDLVHLHGLWGVAGRTLAHARLPSRTRILVSPHGMLEDWAMNRSRIKKQISSLVWENRLFRKASCFHALSRPEADTMRTRIANLPIEVVPNGISLPATYSTPPPDGDILFLGRIVPMKGLDSLLRAWAMGRERGLLSGKRLVLAGWGEGGHEEELKQLAFQLGLRSSEEVCFYGPAFGEAKEQLFAQASGLILPSHNEGLPMMILEAWARGRPVLMTDACHLPIGWETGAALRITTEPESIVSGLERFLALSDQERSAMGSAGRSLAENEFRWDSIAARFALLYQRLITSSPAPTSDLS